MTDTAVVARTTLDFIDPAALVNGGIWSLFAATTAFLGMRLWCKIHRKHGLWYDDYILIACWVSARSPPLQCAITLTALDVLLMVMSDCLVGRLHHHLR